MIGLVHGRAAELCGAGTTAYAARSPADTAVLTASARLYAFPGAEMLACRPPAERLTGPGEVAAPFARLVGPEAGAITGSDYGGIPV